MMKSFLIENWKKFTKTDVPRTLQIVPISSCLEDYGNDIVLIFVNNASYPEYIFKATRNPAYGRKLKNEYYSLKYLYKNQRLSSLIPKPYYLGSYNKNIFFLQGGFAGTSLYKLIRQKGVNQKIQVLINKSVDLLVEIGKAKGSNKVDNNVFYDKNESVYDLLKKEYVTVTNKKKIERLSKYEKIFRKDGNNFYIHGDYWQTNIIVDFKKVKISGIIDWEFSQSSAIYPRDIMWFIINLGYCLGLFKDSSISIPDAYKWAFFTSGDHNKVIASFYHRYIVAIGWDQNLFKFLLEMTLAELSMRELLAYGSHFKMDQIWRELFNYTIENEDKLCLL